MNYNLVVILSFTIAIAAIIGLVKFRRIDAVYYSFIFLMWLGLINEIVSFIVIRSKHSNAINSNIYVLLEAVLIVWFFNRQALFDASKKLFKWLILFYVLAWTLENTWMSSIKKFNSYFIVVYSFATVLMSITQINRLFYRERRMMLSNSVFLICIGFILFYTCKVLIEVFWIYGLNSSKEFRFQVYRIMTFVNVIVNLIFAFAVLWMPKKQEYTLL